MLQRTMPKLAILIWLLAWSIQALANQTKIIDFNLDQLTPVGSASLKVLWFQIYDATLFSQTGDYSTAVDGQQDATNLALELVYKRDIKSARLVTETERQLADRLPKQALTNGLQQVASFWPDIQKADTLTFYMESPDSGHFFYNREHIGHVNAEGFAQAFLNIWIGDDSQYPRLAEQLKGFPSKK